MSFAARHKYGEFLNGSITPLLLSIYSRRVRLLALVSFVAQMTLAYKSRLRFRKFDEYPRVNALPLIIPSTFREVKSSQMKTKARADLGVIMKGKVGQKEEERMDFRFVRVNDRLFKVRSSCSFSRQD